MPWRGSLGYMAAWAGPGDDIDEEIRLCRIEYLGDDDWGFALYDPAAETDEPAVLPDGQPFGSAVEAYVTPCHPECHDSERAIPRAVRRRLAAAHPPGAGPASRPGRPHQ